MVNTPLGRQTASNLSEIYQKLRFLGNLLKIYANILDADWLEC